MSKFYILKNKKPIPCKTVQEWALLFKNDMRRVAFDTINDSDVSTVFLGIDHSWKTETPLLFETMIFGGKHDQYQTRCSTWEEALIQHKEACQLINL